MLRFTVYAILFLLISNNANATEVDNFTDRDPLLKDATIQLNNLMLGYFNEAIRIANEKNSCDSKIITQSLREISYNFGWEQIELDITKSFLIDKRRSLRENSIYQNVSFSDAWALWMAKLGFIMRVNDFFIGSDKLGHFMQQGYYYFEYVYLKNNTLQNALDYGDMTERTYYGLETTGVYSYGDLAANYDGLSFWERVTNTNLALNTKPYFACRDNKWEQITHFTWEDYVTEAWDESVNCSTYRSAAMTDNVNANIAELEKKRFVKFGCPEVDKKKCQEMIEHYGNVAQHIITPSCF